MGSATSAESRSRVSCWVMADVVDVGGVMESVGHVVVALCLVPLDMSSSDSGVPLKRKC